jgi:hypothetical protein
LVRHQLQSRLDVINLAFDLAQQKLIPIFICFRKSMASNYHDGSDPVGSIRTRKAVPTKPLMIPEGLLA